MQPIRNLLSVKRSPLLKVLAAIALTSVLGASASKASLITAGTPFDISIFGTTNAGGTAYLVPTVTATFGNTQVFPVGQGGQVVSVVSYETVVGTQISDTVTISVPTNFDINDTKVAGQPITAMFLDLGEAAEATFGPVTQNGWLLNSAINPAYLTATGSVNDITGFNPLVAVPSTSGSDLSIYAYVGGGSNPPGNDVAPYAFNSFTLTTTVPEPMSAGLLGVVASLGLLRRRRV